MLRAVRVRRIGLMLAGAAMVVAMPAIAQTAPQADPKSGDIIVNGQRMPAAEAPKSATCEALARDPMNRQWLQIAPERVLQPTRLPRDPDYTKPPSVPPGSPLPQLGRGRFGGAQSLATESEVLNPNSGDSTDFAGTGLTPDNLTNAYDDARIACQLRYTRGFAGPDYWSDKPEPVTDGLGTDFTARAQATERRWALDRARIAARDTTLPMAFALFDQGRYAESLDWFQKAHDKLPDEQGGDEASLFLGKLYLQGLGERSNTAEAIKWLKKAALAGFNPRGMTPVFDPKEPKRNTAIGEAAVILGNIYARGFKDVAKDPDEAFRWYKRAYDVGHVPAAKILGDIERDGVGRPRDDATAATWYRKAAKLGLPSAQVALADLLYVGAAGVKQDRHMALGWYKAAATGDEPDALYALGHAYEFGIEVKPDPERAIGLYKTAALKGSAEAATALGTYFHQGKLVPKDEVTARKWFAVAAKENDPDGMYNLGAMLANGQGGERDLAGAAELLKIAAARGHEQAPVALAAVQRKIATQPTP